MAFFYPPPSTLHPKPPPRGFTLSLENGIALMVFIKNGARSLLNRFTQKLFPAQKNRKNTMPFFSAGFTIIELIVAVAIIGVLVSAVVVNFSTSKLKARNNQRISDLQQIQLALEQYYDDHHYYPRCTDGTRQFISQDANVPGSQLLGSDYCSTNRQTTEFGTLQTLSIGTYINSASITPSDPVNASGLGGFYYEYCYSRGYRKQTDTTFIPTLSPTDYILTARLEDVGGSAPPNVLGSACNRASRNVLIGN